MNTSEKRKKRLHACIAFLFLPIIDLWTITYTDIFVNNQTYIGNELHHPLYLFLWGTINALYFWSMTNACLKRYPCMPAATAWIIRICCCGMVLSVLLPYDPQGWFTISKWHVRVAMFSSGGYALLVFCFLFAGVSCGYQQLRPFLFVYLLLCFVSLYSFATHGGVTSFTEISYSISMGFFLYYLRYHR